MPDERDLASARALALRFGYVLEQDFIALCGITEGTAEAWRKHGKGPRYALIGCQYVYPDKDVGEWIAGQLKEPRANSSPRLML